MKRLWVAVAVLAIALGGGELFAKKPGGGGGEPAPDPAIVFVVGPGGELTVTNEDGSNLTVLLTAADGARTPHSPTWSPDGSKLAFKFDDGTNGQGIYTLDVVVDGDSVYGEDLTKIASTTGSIASHCSWSPAAVFGKYRIAFSMDDEDEGQEVFLVNADGTGEPTTLDKAQGDISWSPTGDRLATTPHNRSLKIHHLEQDEPGGPVYVGYSPRYDLYNEFGVLMRCWSVAWSKTQDHVLAVAVGPDSGGPADLWIVDLRDGVLSPDTPPAHVDVFILEADVVLTYTRDFEDYPTWSPDDSSLMFKLEGTPKAGLYVFDDLSGTEDPSLFYKNKKKSVFWPDWRR